MASTFPLTIEDLDEVRKLQRQTYRWAVEAAALLEPGVTEREVGQKLLEMFEKGGVRQMFHEPFVWFGDRTMLGATWVEEDAGQDLVGLSRASKFFPTDKRLEVGMPAIIDLAPVSANGLPTDMGYSCIVGRNEIYDELLAGLEPMRNFLLGRVRAGDTLQKIYRDLDTMIADHGWENCHRRYPQGALGHVVPRLPPDPTDHAPPIAGFGTSAGDVLIAAITTATHDHSCFPVWNDTDGCAFPPTPGLWAVEPHIGRNGVGAKWEEILVVTQSDAFWLDDDLPHHRRWRGLSALPD